MKKIIKGSLEDKVYNYKTKYEEGFTDEEMKELLKDYPNINMDKFNDAMYGNTCMLKEGKLINYHCDVLTALRCGTENRDMHYYEFD